MVISLNTYSNNYAINYQNKIKKQPENQGNAVSFKSNPLAEVVRKEVAVAPKAKVLASLAAALVAIGSTIGIKPKEERKLNALLKENSFSIARIKKCEDLYGRLLSVYKENPALFKELITARSTEFVPINQQYDYDDVVFADYDLESIIAISEIAKEKPASVDLAKKAFKNRDCTSVTIGNKERAEALKREILEDSANVEQVYAKISPKYVCGDVVSRLLTTIKKEKAEAIAIANARFIEVWKNVEEKFGIKITRMYTEPQPSKGDCDIVYYTHNGKEYKCYIPSPCGGSSEIQVLETLLKRYNNVEDFRCVPLIDIVHKKINF